MSNMHAKFKLKVIWAKGGLRADKSGNGRYGSAKWRLKAYKGRYESVKGRLKASKGRYGSAKGRLKASKGRQT